MVVDPLGVVIAGLGADEGILDARINRGAVEQARQRNPSLANRRR
jgi:predicted amidohydrolase